MSEFKPLKVEFEILNLALPTMPIHLDDLVAAAAVIRAKEQSGGASIQDYDAIIDRLPIEQYFADDDWVYKASVITFSQVHGAFMRPYSKRINETNFALRCEEGTLKSGLSAINHGSGPLKASVGMTPTVAKAVGIAYCIGDEKEVTELLGFLSNVGKRHNRGHGKILSLSVSKDKDAQNSGAWARRHLPMSMADLALEDHALVSQLGIRPPYWKNIHEAGYGITHYLMKEN